MTVTGTTTTAVAVLRDWRGWPTVLTALWRRSLRFRTLSITLAATSLAIFVTCVTMALVIQNDLFVSQKNIALEDARRAIDQAQNALDVAELGDDPGALQDLWTSIQGQLARNSSADQLAGFRLASTGTLNGFTNGLSRNQLSAGLENRVAEFDDRQAWQSVALPVEDGREVPGIVVGQQLQVPQAGSFAIYLAYDLGDADQTLVFVQRTLWIAGIALVAIVAGISWIVLRAVASPIVQAAETSARLAAGDLGVRLEVRGEDELATLGRSFNAMADSIEGQIKELGELSMVQQRFVSDVSHELRTPLTTIRLAADMLNDQRADFEPTTARTAELLYAQVQRFDVLLSDLLEISRYDAGSVQLELEETSLAHVAEDVIEQMRPLALSHGTELRLVAPGGYSPVEMDPRRVRRVLRNLIGNAIEHGEGRPIVVTVDSNQHAVAAGVRDFGLGMSPADAERVFDRFWRADPSRQRTIGGTGLGLSIALGDATIHGGTLAVWSALGEGTNFVLTLPRRGAVTDGPSPVPVEPEEPLAELDDATQPISLVDLPPELREEWGL
ncbi:Sensor histidine kinase MtrB [Microbacterium oxydans]|uniref:Sensor histidine kinase MtrB n=1 Tax=Microbacterium oxydans TaxID=82380 RepID=A0A0F0L7U4_9MICO|nr:MtrAB system histidine kinase MtrB [Microbacterium oxydans]KJL28380.1 Sensor histidine kinase MtrB [Microbacterium oxydans]CAH0229728.1 Sensor histidine kinase MtrB [Microbacterium oxydans]